MSIYRTKLPEHPSLLSVSVEGVGGGVGGLGLGLFTSACFQENFTASNRTVDTIKFIDLMMVSHPFLD